MVEYGTSIREQVDFLKVQAARRAEFSALKDEVMKISGVKSAVMWEDMLMVKVRREQVDKLDVAALEEIHGRIKQWGLRCGISLDYER